MAAPIRVVSSCFGRTRLEAETGTEAETEAETGTQLVFDPQGVAGAEKLAVSPFPLRGIQPAL